LESLARLAMERGGVPAPELQFTIGPYRVDFCWPSAWLVLEVDGRQKYQHLGDLFSEKRREVPDGVSEVTVYAGFEASGTDLFIRLDDFTVS
jgi:hypothetical protein